MAIVSISVEVLLRRIADDLRRIAAKPFVTDELKAYAAGIDSMAVAMGATETKPAQPKETK